MNIEEFPLDLDSSKLATNLRLYKILKDVIQVKLTHNRIVRLIEQLKLLENSESPFHDKKDICLDLAHSLSKHPKSIQKIQNFLSIVLVEDMDFDLLRTALLLYRFKDYILSKSKLLSENFRVSSSYHIMDFSYDYNLLLLPYSVRVAGALLIKVLFDQIGDPNNPFYASIYSNLIQLEQLEPSTILQIIYAESASQSIRSTAGQSYEKRFEALLISKKIKYSTQSHDSKIKAVEYDFKIFIGQKSIGVSVKRTLRERYKQNHEEVEQLDVDAMLIVTLGIDLNETKVENITQKEKQYIFVAADIYHKNEFLSKNKNVYPLTNLNRRTLRQLIS
ncbi:MAG: hypothetical protein AB8E82_07975 [Aureispira sp.]